MAEEEPRTFRVDAPHVDQQQVEIVEIVLEAANEASLAIGMAVPPQVDRLDGVAAANKFRGHGRMPPAVVVKAMDEENDRGRVPLGEPLPPVEAEAIAADEIVFAGLHNSWACHYSPKSSLRQ